MLQFPVPSCALPQFCLCMCVLLVQHISGLNDVCRGAWRKPHRQFPNLRVLAAIGQTGHQVLDPYLQPDTATVSSPHLSTPTLARTLGSQGMLLAKFLSRVWGRAQQTLEGLLQPMLLPLLAPSQARFLPDLVGQGFLPLQTNLVSFLMTTANNFHCLNLTAGSVSGVRR